MIDTIFCLALFFLAAATILYFLYGYKQKSSYFNFGTIILFIGTISLAILLLLIGIRKSQHPTTSTFESFNFLALVVLVIYFIAEYKFRIRLLCLFLPTIALLLMTLSVLIPQSDFMMDEIFSVEFLSTHIAFTLIGEAGFLLATAAAIMYLIQEQNIKKKRFSGTFFKLPSLNRLERMAHFSIIFGFPFFTVGLIFGFIQAAKSLGEGWIFDIKIFIAMFIWVAYLILFILRIRKRLYGKAFIIWLMISFILVVFSYTIVNYLSDFHYFIYSGGL